MARDKVTEEKMQILAHNSCIRITPYMEFQDGMYGSVLLLRYNADDSLMLLIDSPEREFDDLNGRSGSLLPIEVDLIYTYKKACKDRYDGHYCISKEDYQEFKVIVLTDLYFSAVAADAICKSVNERSSTLYSWNMSRVYNMVTNALTEARASEIIEEIREFQSEDCKWQRDILYQALAQWNCEKALDHNPDFLWRKASIKYADWISHKNIKTKLYCAKQLLAAYHQEGTNFNWGQILEKTLREERNKEISFRYLDYGVQETIGLYALSRYIYTEKPESFSLKYSEVPMVERIALYGDYFEECTQEVLAELNAIDDPTRTHLPNEDEASQIAKQRIEAMMGRKPEGLTKEQQKTYATYEEHACMSQGILKEHESEKTQQEQTKKNTPNKPDLTTEFLPHYTRTAKCEMMLNFLLDEKDKASDTDWARYALAIYRCKIIFRNRPRFFKNWLPTFCSLLGREVAYRAPSNIDRTKCTNDITVFLPE